MWLTKWSTASWSYWICGWMAASTSPPVRLRQVRESMPPSWEAAMASSIIRSESALTSASCGLRMNSSPPYLTTTGLARGWTRPVSICERAASASRPPTSTPPIVTPSAIVSLRLESHT